MAALDLKCVAVVRHGEYAINGGKFDLSETGKDQIRTAASMLSNVTGPFSKILIITTGEVRTEETGDLIKTAYSTLDIEVIRDSISYNYWDESPEFIEDFVSVVESHAGVDCLVVAGHLEFGPIVSAFVSALFKTDPNANRTLVERNLSHGEGLIFAPSSDGVWGCSML